MTRKKKILVGTLSTLMVLLIVWVAINPPGTFGYCRFALTTYGSVPYPALDIQVQSDGRLRFVDKTHDLKFDAIEWLLASGPDVLIICKGWQGVVRVNEDITAIDNCTVEVLKTGEAISRFRELKKQGKKVAIHVHSTC